MVTNRCNINLTPPLVGIVRAEAKRTETSVHEVLYGVPEHFGLTGTTENIARAIEYLDAHMDELKRDGFVSARVTYEDLQDDGKLTTFLSVRLTETK